MGCSLELAAPIAGDGTPDSQPLRGGVLRISSSGDLRSLDPAASSDAVSTVLLNLLFEGLVGYDPDGRLVPELAERFTVDPSGLRYRFTLRRNVRFHDGEELTARDIKRSLTRALLPSTPNPYRSLFDDLVGAESLRDMNDDLAGVEVAGRYELTFALARRNHSFLHALAQPSARPVCQGSARSKGAEFVPCGTGPFRLEPGKWVRGVDIVVDRFDGYYRAGLPWLDGVHMIFGQHQATVRHRFLRGDIDIVRDLGHADATRFRSDPRWQPLTSLPTPRTIFGESMNTEIPPFDNVEVRRAVAAALNRKQISALKPTHLAPTGQPVAKGLDGHIERGAQVSDTDAALEHMRRAGYPFDPSTGKGGYPRAIPYYTMQQGLSELTAQLVQQQLSAIGLRTEIRLVSWPTYLTMTRRRGAVAMSPQGWIQDYPDPQGILEPLFSSSSINDQDSSNTSFFRDPSLDALLAEGRAESDPVARRRLYERASEILCDQAPWAFAYNVTWFEVQQPYVRNYAPHPVWDYFVRDTWLDRRGSQSRSAIRSRGREALTRVSLVTRGAP